MNIYTPVVLIGILVGITFVLIGLDRLLGGSGERLITINKTTKVPVLGDDTVLRALAENKVFLPSACGGKATCGTCKFRLVGGDTEILPTEEPFLSAEERADGIRLACQVKVRGDMEIEVPNSLLSAREYVTVVEHIEDLTYDIKLVRCRLLESEEIDFKPGQYAQLRVPGMEDVIRAYSIASNPKDKDFFELIIRMVPKGLATTFVHKAMEIGDKLIITGPFGDFYLREDSDRDIVCIAGGSGKAPIRSIVHYLRDRGMPRKVKYFFGAR
ncbi:MAG TPA: 2Fe-2S iron-sulfur cluster binding domain-containing protein, partial [Bacillota bacterium]|nr:2Fe-2S iron-sulfur cluster binding domain-containing protein [Bacillota bacterium]